MAEIDVGDTLVSLTKYLITGVGALLLVDAMGFSPIKFKMDKLHAVVIGAPLLSTGIVAIALTKK